jgi:hydrogenase large subunit
MATTIVVDPLTRIEGHNRFTVTVTADGTVLEANSSGTLFRGFENILNGRDPRDAPQITQRICGVCPTAHAMASVRAVDDALNVQVPVNGLMVRNIIHGSDTIMSHITHFYHLAALDFVDATILGSPWEPAFKTLSNCALLSVLAQNEYTSKTILNNYVEALDIRRECHTMASIFGGRFPIQNALVPGGVSTIFTLSDIDKFKTHINKVRNFINTTYIPDVVFVATRSHSFGGGKENWTQFWSVGTSPQNLLSYGEYPLAAYSRWPAAGNSMLLARGVYINGTGAGALNLEEIKEYVDHSYYDASDNAKHPNAGTTTPKVSYVGTGLGDGTHYSWLKAPRYAGKAMEVGPLARVAITYLTAATSFTVAENDSTPINIANILTLPTDYTIADLVNKTFLAANGVTGAGLTPIPHLFSPLGRHACRALECKIVADALGGRINGGSSVINLLTLNNTQTTGATVATGSGYTYVKIPKNTSMGTGLAEVPRGSLGHWITIQSKKIGKYQCVVPTTWNASPKGGPVSSTRGPAEANLVGVVASGNTNDAILNVARMLHPYDFCIACAVHLVTPDGKNIAKFNMSDGGKITKIPNDSE